MVLLFCRRKFLEKKEITTAINKAIPCAVLDAREFGRSEVLSIWVETSAIQSVSRYLKESPQYRFNWLENMAVMQVDGAMVISYFIRGIESNWELILRVSVVPPTENGRVGIKSVADVWQEAEYFEKENSALFGIEFLRDNKSSVFLDRPNFMFEGNKEGYPLRNYFRV
jgi:NADH:ubiquinone oxidoreductase subunit C